ncbi:MAG: hypothetical protein ACTSQA_01220 [Candidatus Heimdallarchaeaceae archaeon]
MTIKLDYGYFAYWECPDCGDIIYENPDCYVEGGVYTKHTTVMCPYCPEEHDVVTPENKNPKWLVSDKNKKFIINNLACMIEDNYLLSKDEIAQEIDKLDNLFSPT